MTNKYDAVIIGAGLTGLVTAMLLKRKGLSVLVIEKAGRTGGAIRTLRSEGYVYESGPSTASLSNVETLELFDKLRGKCELEIARKEAKKRFILKNGVPHKLPNGIVEGIRTPLFSLNDKFRILAEPLRKAGANPDESIASLVERRMGKSFLDYAAQPFVGGIYAGDPELLVTRFALPKLYELEQRYGSFISGAVRKARSRSDEEKRATKDVFSVKGGFGKLIEALTECVGRENIALNQDCKALPGGDGGVRRIELSTGHVYAEKVISTVGGHAVGEIFDFMPASTRMSIEKLRYAKIIQVAVGIKPFPKMDTNAFGLLIPSVEKRRLLGVLYPSSCFENRAPDGNVLLSVFAGGINNPGILEKSDEEIQRTIGEELDAIYRLPESHIEFMEIFRHPHAIPQYELTCKEMLTDIAEFERANPGIILAGNIRDGIGIPNRIKQAFDIQLRIEN